MTHTSKICLSLLALAALGLVARPAEAATLTAEVPVVYGSSASDIFPTIYGKDGSIEFDTTADTQPSGKFMTQDTFTPVSGKNAAGDVVDAQTIKALPIYISSVAGFSVDHAAGYGHPDIAPGREAGQVGHAPGDGGGSIFSFTVGAAKSFTFGVLANYSNNIQEDPKTVTLTDNGAVPLTASVAAVTAKSGPQFGTVYLFRIVNATPGETFTVSTDQGYISGATFAPLLPSPPK